MRWNITLPDWVRLCAFLDNRTNTQTMKYFCFFCSLLGLTVPGNAVSHSGASGIVKNRRLNSQCLAIALITFMSVSTTLASEGIDGIQTRLQANNLAIVAAGEVVYQAHCASCHGVQLEGQPNWRKRNDQGYLPAPPHDATGHTWHHADDLLFEITKYGPGAVIGDNSYQSLMPVFQPILSDNDIIAVLSYIKNSWPEKERSWQEEINGDQGGGFIPTEKKSSLLDKLFK